MKIKTIVSARLYIEKSVNDFIQGVDVVDIQTHLASDQQVIAIIVYKEESGHGRK